MTNIINPARKIFAGPRLRRLRRERSLTQARMAEELAVSPSYLNLMERNQRPITVPVLIRLADIYGVDPRDFMEDRTETAVEDMEHILADPLFRDAGVGRAELHDAAEYAPALLGAMHRLYRAYGAARETTGSAPFCRKRATTFPRSMRSRKSLPRTSRSRDRSRSSRWPNGCAAGTASGCGFSPWT
jgi:transcriptional regulator with XRE-family HTH domain